jgi:MFS family permease
MGAGVASETRTADERQPLALLFLYALAYAGAVIAYTPFLMLLLPMRVAELAGAADIRWLGYILFAGALAASVSAIASGWLSDRTRNRRGWIGAGLALSVALQLSMAHCTSVAALLWLVVAWQLALNLMLTPLIAWAGDFVPDRQKGLLGGLLAFAPALGAWSSLLVARETPASFADNLWLVSIVAVAAVLPLLIAGRPRPLPTDPGSVDIVQAPRRKSAAAIRMWLARLAMQVPGAALASYLYFWLRALDPAMTNREKMLLFAVGLSLSIGAAMALGRWSDRRDRPFAVLALLAACTGLLLGAMAAAPSPGPAKLAYLLFSGASAAFLALHASQTLRVLPDPARRATGIGLFNLTNTAPSLIMPWIAIALVPDFGFAGLFLLLAMLAFIAAALLAAMPRGAH